MIDVDDLAFALGVVAYRYGGALQEQVHFCILMCLKFTANAVQHGDTNTLLYCAVLYCAGLN